MHDHLRPAYGLCNHNLRSMTDVTRMPDCNDIKCPIKHYLML